MSSWEVRNQWFVDGMRKNLEWFRVVCGAGIASAKDMETTFIMDSLPNQNPELRIKGTDLFTIFRFGFPSENSQTHGVASMGYFMCPIEAFEAAKDSAQLEFERVRDAAAHVEELVLIATEFGYEVRDGARTIVRYWIKSRAPHSASV